MALRASRPGMRLPMRVWDLPVRCFHWAIVVLVIVSYVSAKTHHMQVHLLSGYTVLTLLLFRLAWGIVGSETARFAAFVKSPLAALRHLARFGRAAPDDQVGHNEAGGWMVLILLLLLAAQVGTGLCSHTRTGVAGPLSKVVGPAASDQISRLHGTLFYVLLAAIVLHVLAIAAYAAFQRQNLLRPMLTGKKLLPAATRQPRMAPALLGWGILLLAAAAVWLFVRFV
jgi:cytochrome b